MTLTEVAFYTRKTIKWGGIVFAILLVLVILWQPLLMLKNAIMPSPRPTAEFGTLPNIDLEEFPKSKGQFVLQTTTGELPKEIRKIAKVYLIPGYKSSFFDLEKAKQVAQQFGFNPEASKITDVVYRFTHPQMPAVLDINIVNRAFAISYSLDKTPELLQKRPQSEKDAIQTATSFLSRGGFMTDELKKGESETQLLKIQNGKLTPAIALSETTFIKVNLQRANLDGLPVINPNPDKSSVWFLVAGQNEGKIIAGEYHHFPVDETKSSAYPIKTVEEAWNELQSGQGYVIRASGEPIVRRVYLAYLDTGKPQEFLQPVFVFDGGNKGSNLRVIVPAITHNYYSQQTGKSRTKN